MSAEPSVNSPPDSRPPRRHRITAVEVVALLGVAFLVFQSLLPTVIYGRGEYARVFACTQNLAKLYSGLAQYEQKFGTYPSEPGPKFLLSLWTSGVLEHNETNRDLFLCPGVDNDPEIERIRGTPIGVLWARLDLVSGDDTHYAGRNTKDPSLARNLKRGSQCLAADDNEHGSNHQEGIVNFLTGDGAIRNAQKAILVEEGLMTREDTFIPVGPDSPVRDLRHVIAR